MKVKIIANAPLEDGCSSIQKYVGGIYEVIDQMDNEQLYVDFEVDDLVIYPGEYEIIEE